MTTDRRPARRWALVLLLAVVATMLVALRPSGTTLAAWSDELSVELPPLTTAGIGMSVSASGTGARIVVSGDAAGTWRPSDVTLRAGGQPLTGDQLAGTTLEYRLAGADGRCTTSAQPRYSVAPSGAVTTFPVTGAERLSGERTLCLTVKPADRLRVSHGGQALTVSTTLDGAAGTWTAAGAWAAGHQMPPAPSVSTPSCQKDRGGVTLSWNWVDGVPVTGWSVQVSQGATWKDVVDVGSTSTSVRLTARNFDRLFQFSDYEARIVALLPDGTQIASASTVIGVERLIIGTVYCR